MPEVDQFEACKKLAEFIGCPDPEYSAYIIQQFVVLHTDGETPSMALALAKRTWADPTPFRQI